MADCDVYRRRNCAMGGERQRRGHRAVRGGGDSGVPRCEAVLLPLRCRIGRRQQAPTRSSHHAVEATWGSLTAWDVFDRTPLALRRWRVNALGKRATLLFSLPIDSGAPAVESSQSLDTVGNFSARASSRIRHRRLRRKRKHARPLVGHSLLPVRHRRGRTSEQSRGNADCVRMWFGGTFDREGQPLTQIVRVGPWLQTRPVEP